MRPSGGKGVGVAMQKWSKKLLSGEKLSGCGQALGKNGSKTVEREKNKRMRPSVEKRVGAATQK